MTSMTKILHRVSGNGELWLGNVDAARAARENGFDTVVFCAMEEQPTQEAMPGIEVLAHPFDDAHLTLRHWHDANRLAKRVVRRVRLGKKVLVTCWMGLNRSGLVVALACHMLTNKPGPEIVATIQRKRDGALCNRSFAARIALL